MHKPLILNVQTAALRSIVSGLRVLRTAACLCIAVKSVGTAPLVVGISKLLLPSGVADSLEALKESKGLNTAVQVAEVTEAACKFTTGYVDAKFRQRAPQDGKEIKVTGPNRNEIKEILDKHAKTEDGKSWQDLRREGTIHVTQDTNRGTYHWVSKEYVEDLKEQGFLFE